MRTRAQCFEDGMQEIIAQNAPFRDEKARVEAAIDNINRHLEMENARRSKENRMMYISDMPPLGIAMLLATREDMALIAPGDKSQTNKKPNLSAEERMKLPIGIYQYAGDNKGIFEVTNDPFGAFGIEVEKYEPGASRKEKQEIFTLVKSRLRVVRKCVVPFLVAVNNGIFDVKHNKFYDFTPKLVFTSKIHTDLNLQATNPVIDIPDDGTTWDVDSWFASLGTPSFVESIKEVIQAACLPLAPRDTMCLLYSREGEGGKGTICQLIRNLLGENVVVSIPIEDFSKKFALAGLPRAIAVITDENNVSSFNKGLGNLKAVITGDPVTIEEKYQKSYNFAFRGLILQCINDYPRGNDKTFSFKRRLHIIPFQKCFTGRAKRYIKDKIIYREDVLQYILKIVLVDMDYREEFTKTAETEAALDACMAATNSVITFLREILPECRWNLLPATAFLFKIYEKWYKDFSPSGSVIGRNEFIDSVKEVVATDPDLSSEWEWTKSTRSQGYIDCSIREPLLDRYNLIDLMDDMQHVYQQRRFFACKHKLKDNYSGLKRRVISFAKTQAIGARVAVPKDAVEQGEVIETRNLPE